MVRASASAFMCATMSTSPLAASVATQVTSPSASNLGASARPSSTACVVPGSENAKVLNRDLVGSGRSASRRAHQRDEARLLLRIVEQAGELGGDGHRAGLLDTAH